MVAHHTPRMGAHLTFATSAAVAFALAQSACSNPNGDDCKYTCEAARASGPHIGVTPDGAAIAAIETLPGASVASTRGGCAVSWSGFASEIGQAEPICPSSPVDAGQAGNGCASRYLCAPPASRQLDGGFRCTEAWINMNGDRCVVTVVSTSGERQMFDVTVTATTAGYRCRTGTDQCVEVRSTLTEPAEISLIFESLDGGPYSDHGLTAKPQ